jgi:hypothetical protein
MNKPIPLCWSYNDGGRKDAGFAGSTGDCVTRAIAIASKAPYIQVYELINRFGQMERKSKYQKSKSSARTGVYRNTIKRIMNHLGYEWVSCMGIGTGCKVHLRRNEVPMTGTIIASVSKHLVTIVDGVIQDTHDCSRGGNRCVYGYWIVR